MDPKPVFSGSVAENYEKYMVPIFFEPYSKDIVSRLTTGKVNSILEIACGTGQVTRQLIERLPEARITATDLNPGMIEVAKKTLGGSDKIKWGTADALELPFDGNIFDAVVCQFGLMFVPDKQKAFNEAYRVLKPGGKFIFNTWDRMDNNPVKKIAHEITNTFFPGDPVNFWQTPLSMHKPDEMKSLMQNAGFKDVSVNLVSVKGHADSARNAALALTLGTPIYPVLCERGKEHIPAIIDKLTEAISKEYGKTDLSIPLKAWVVEGVK